MAKLFVNQTINQTIWLPVPTHCPAQVLPTRLGRAYAKASEPVVCYGGEARAGGLRGEIVSVGYFQKLAYSGWLL